MNEPSLASNLATEEWRIVVTETGDTFTHPGAIYRDREQVERTFKLNQEEHNVWKGKLHLEHRVVTEWERV